jgi:hypothetical protein
MASCARAGVAIIRDNTIALRILRFIIPPENTRVGGVDLRTPIAFRSAIDCRPVVQEQFHGVRAPHWRGAPPRIARKHAGCTLRARRAPAAGQRETISSQLAFVSTLM